jgi:3-keto-5-aminohexanoate cleavage enzyme
MNPVIINLCPTGMVPTRAQSAQVPLTPAEVVADVARCVERGANLVHLHACDEQGRPHFSRAIYARQIAGIRERFFDLTICVSLSGRTFGEFAQRAEALGLRGDLRPDMGSLTLSSLNFADQASVNAPDMVRRLADAMAEQGIKPELEVFDLGMLNYAQYLISKGVLEPPFYFNILLGNIAGAQPTPAHVAAFLSALPPGSIWCAAGLGRHQLTANVLGLLYGDGVRVGLEDNLWFDDRRERPASNADLIERISTLIAALQRTVATRAEVRQRLGIRPL